MTVWKNLNDISEVDPLKVTLITRNDKVFGLFTTETSMKFNNLQNNLADIEKFTIAQYEDNAESFRVGTKDHDVSQYIEAFLGALPKKTLEILNYGCGPGRDMFVFKSLGHRPVGLDGCKKFCKMT